MMTSSLKELVLLGLLFVSVAAAVLFLLSAFGDQRLRRRLQNIGPGTTGPVDFVAGPSWWRRVEQVAKPFAKLSLPDSDIQEGSFRARFFNAGLRDASAPSVYFAAKTLLAIALPSLLYLFVLNRASPGLAVPIQLFLVLVTAAFGYYLPNGILARLISSRQTDIFEAFPDALDLMTVCVEAGLGTEAAISRVANDIETRSAVLSEELRLMGLELRAGVDRAQALRNIAVRTAVEEVETWAAMLIQAERFGTSLVASLRVHADMLRTKRRQRAEEAAAKIALKLLFPLIFFIFPSLMLVLMGPAMIQIYRVFLHPTGGSP